MYACTGTRPDLTFAVHYLARFANRPTKEAWTAIKHILRYMQGTLDYGLCYQRTDDKLLGCTAYSDSDWGACVNTSRSTMGFVFMFAGAAVSWSSKQQSRVADSSTDAEYLALGHAAKEAIYIRQLLWELGVQDLKVPTLIYGDNQGANALTKTPKFHDRTRHLRLNEHKVREYAAGNEIKIEYIPTSLMNADILTKPLNHILFAKHRAAMGMVQTGA